MPWLFSWVLSSCSFQQQLPPLLDLGDVRVQRAVRDGDGCGPASGTGPVEHARVANAGCGADHTVLLNIVAVANGG
jgi:hypothetical protein